MGQQVACCVLRDAGDPAKSDPNCRTSPAVGSAWKSSQQDGTHNQLEDLQEVVHKLERETRRLAECNGYLLQKNKGLHSENIRLKQELEDSEIMRQWEPFDVLEEHYRQLDHHRSSLGDVVYADGDEAAGSPPRESAAPSSSSFFPSPRRPTPRRTLQERGGAWPPKQQDVCAEVPLSPRVYENPVDADEQYWTGSKLNDHTRLKLASARDTQISALASRRDAKALLPVRSASK
mmetsp:Transcript_57392/g.136417  ORF Transcript_57392/g.136417 Transcript_57392/m.136417 type:complete len:234 (-) Transcript_57392:77-778(-)